MSTDQKLLEQAIAHFNAGRLVEVDRLCRQMIEQQPNESPAYDILGCVAIQVGQPVEAERLIRHAIRLEPRRLGYLLDLAAALMGQKRYVEAISLQRQAIAARPNWPEAYSNLGSALLELKRLDEAEQALKKAIELRPEYAGAWYNLGNVRRDQDQLDAAMETWRKALSINPNFPEALNNLGIALGKTYQAADSIPLFKRAIELRPDYAEAHGNLAAALVATDDPVLAVAQCHRALQLNPRLVDSWSNLSCGLELLNQVDEAIAAARRAIEIDPDYSSAHFNLGMLLLKKNQFEDGWREYEWRWKVKGHLSTPTFSQPYWGGEPLNGRKILLFAEQGLGDAIQFVRYVNLVAERGGKVILLSHRDLVSLFKSLPNIEAVVPEGELLPEFDVHAPLMSLPRIFNTTLATIPAPTRYISPGATHAQKWHDRAAGEGEAMKIGLVWAGRPTHLYDRLRSIRLTDLAPLADAGDCKFFSLQKGPAGDQARTPPTGMQLVDWAGELTDFADTAALVDQLDLVISVDTSVAHLAAALGKPVWILLKYSSEWRWMLDRTDSPWYPTVRLFRQRTAGDWTFPIAEIRRSLQSLAASR